MIGRTPPVPLPPNPGRCPLSRSRVLISYGGINFVADRDPAGPPSRVSRGGRHPRRARSESPQASREGRLEFSSDAHGALRPSGCRRWILSQQESLSPILLFLPAGNRHVCSAIPAASNRRNPSAKCVPLTRPTTGSPLAITFTFDAAQKHSRRIHACGRLLARATLAAQTKARRSGYRTVWNPRSYRVNPASIQRWV